ncbi:hypothetical protein SARC_15122 [Sphaeroforma arctica JP610]|uniref:Uncharacterized protein n=1 Tax=Sphaeroforma arctica JP610 TaxID=667725 RepID=A0A0L0F6H5_9EUKA|nr:hypothetical protein SARC_15122 [Sphaeroforma arctica JP610]KNC72325.1 hypothetical protein SARC_15122 [Sphaeroforma arctica JP610]|eukprot:XP_014146227.1 hypothetical protein SARC_15122 [Sphaeroforma arctica JP610]
MTYVTYFLKADNDRGNSLSYAPTNQPSAHESKVDTQNEAAELDLQRLEAAHAEIQRLAIEIAEAEAQKLAAEEIEVQRYTQEAAEIAQAEKLAKESA